MICRFSTAVRRRLYDVNRVAYRKPTPHPTRILAHHDIFYVMKGGFVIEVEDQVIRAGRDSVVILPSGYWHKGTENCEADTHTLWLLMEKEEEDTCIFDDDHRRTSEWLSLSLCVDASGRPSILKYFEKILLAHIDGDEARASSYLTLLLCELYDADHKKAPGILMAEEIRQMIDLNLEKSLSNEDIALAIGRSVKTVETVFKKHFGMTIHRYVIQEKLKKGKRYLEYFPDMSLRDIAIELNFYDEYHFSRQFKKEYGISPADYKKQYFAVDRYNFAREN